MPAAKPSQVLPGLTCGASLCLPNVRPPKYAPTSAAAISTIRYSSSNWPFGCSVTRCEQPDAGRHQHEETRRRRPPRRPPACARSASHTNATSHQRRRDAQDVASSRAGRSPAPRAPVSRAGSRRHRRAEPARSAAGEARPFAAARRRPRPKSAPPPRRAATRPGTTMTSAASSSAVTIRARRAAFIAQPARRSGRSVAARPA